MTKLLFNSELFNIFIILKSSRTNYEDEKWFPALCQVPAIVSSEEYFGIASIF